MSQTKTKFGCCDRVVSSPHKLSCKLCKYKFHLSCVNLQKPFKDLSDEFKSNWTCPSCRSKLPKSDNTNTPVRAAYQQTAGYEQDEVSQNVNLRRGGQTDKILISEEPLQDVRSIVREELESILDNFKISILKQFDLRVEELLNRFKQVSDSLSVIEKQQEVIRAEVTLNTSHISRLESENATLRSSIADLNSRLVRAEQHSRANNLEIQNIPEHKSENLVSIAKQIATTVNYKLNESDIHICTRIAKVNRDSKRPRSVIIKFSSPRVRDEFLAATLRFNKKAKSVSEKINTSHLGISGEKKPVYIVEHLSPAQKAVHAAARIKAKELSYKFVWVKGGKVYMRRTETSDYKLIKSVEELSQLN